MNFWVNHCCDSHQSYKKCAVANRIIHAVLFNSFVNILLDTFSRQYDCYWCLFLMSSTPNGLNICFNILTTPKVNKDSYVGNIYPHISKTVVAMTTQSGDKSDVNTFMILSLLQFSVQLWNVHNSSLTHIGWISSVGEHVSKTTLKKNDRSLGSPPSAVTKSLFIPS